MSKFKKVIEESFAGYAGAVLQSRALVDVRDGLKPSARQIFYCLYTDKMTHDKPFTKTIKVIGSAFRMYIHGDSSAEGVIMRAGQPFAMRYPLVEVDGSYGSLLESGNWGAPRYTSTRLAPLSHYLFDKVHNETIAEWRDNYDDTEKFPTVLPSLGFYNIVNGTMGIGIGMASSIPAFNLREVNDAMIKLLWDPDISFDEIYCAPDFPTGGVLLNEEEVKESLRTGQGKSCRIRSVVEYDTNENALVVREVPYSVYTNTICRELEKILTSDENPGIERFNDLTGSEPLIKIYLSKKANPQRVISYLYKKTSLQSFFGVNMTMLKDGRFPKVFGWKEALQEHLTHEALVYTNYYKNIKEKAENRLHVVEGLIRAISMIDEVVTAIRGSNSTADAKKALGALGFSTPQTNAILAITLGRLVNLEIAKLSREKEELLVLIEKISAILNDETLLKKEIQKGLEAVSKQFGDARRTKILNIAKEDEEEPEEITEILINLTSFGALLPQKTSTLFTQKRRAGGVKLPLEKGEVVLDSLQVKSNQNILLFDKQGKYYNYPVRDLLDSPRTFVGGIVSIAPFNSNPYIVFITKKGMIKKSHLGEYSSNRKTGMVAISLNPGDSIVSVHAMNEEPIGILSNTGNFITFETSLITPIGRNTKGVKAIALKDDEYVVAGNPISPKTREILILSKKGIGKRTPLDEYPITNRGVKGVKGHSLRPDDESADFLALGTEKEVLLVSTNKTLRLNVNDIPSSGRATIGAQLMRVKENEILTNVLKI